MKICYECHEYHADENNVCNFCEQSTLLDAEIPEELEDECNAAIQ